MPHKLRLMLSLLLISTFVCSVPSLACASFETKLDKGISAVDSNLANLASFDGKCDRIFSRFSQSQRDEIGLRVKYVVEQSKMNSRALKSFRDDRRFLFDTGTGAISGGKHFARLNKTIDSFEDYRLLFSSSIAGAFVEAPEPRYLRIQRELESTPWYKYGQVRALRRELEKAFISYSDKFVEKTIKANRTRWDSFFHAIKNLQYSSSGFDLGLQYRLDRSFYALQSTYAKKLSPDYGVPQIDEFPVDAALSNVVVFKPTSYGRQYSKSFDMAKVDKLLPSSYSEMKELPPEALSRAARRIKELHELVSTYEKSAQRGDATALDESWSAYEKLRERWDKVD